MAKKTVSRRLWRAVILCATLPALLAATEQARAAGWGPEIPAGDSLVSLPMDAHIDERGNATVLNAFPSMPATGSFSLVAIENGVPRTLWAGGATDFDEFDALFGSIPVRSGMDADGQVSAVWLDCNCAANHQMRAVAVGADRKPINPAPLIVADLPENAVVLDFNYTVSPQGEAVAAVVLESEGDTWIEAYRIDKAQTSAEKITADGFGADADSVLAGISSAGEIYLAWRADDQDGPVIRGQAFGPSGPAGQTRDLLTSGEEYENVELEGLPVDSRGIASVFFHATKTGLEIADFGMSRLSAATGARIGSDFEVIATTSTSAVGLDRGKNIALAPDDSIRIAHVDRDEAGDTATINLYTIDPEGAVQGPELISEGNMIAMLPTVGLAGDGSGGVAYIGFKGADLSLGVDVRFRHIDASGNLVGAPETVATAEADLFELTFMLLSYTADVAEDAAIVAWSSGELLVPDMSTTVRLYDARPPVVEIKAPNKVLAGEEVFVRATVTDMHTTTKTWDFGDGSTAEGELTAHAFEKPGKYTLRMTAVDLVGNETVVEREIAVYADPDAPERPDTRITRPPALRLKVPRANIHFASTQADSTFECRVGRGPLAGSREARLRAQGKGGKGLVVQGRWRPCTSPLRLRGLRPALYVVRVRAVGPTGLRDLSPAITRFRVTRPAKPHRR